MVVLQPIRNHVILSEQEHGFEIALKVAYEVVSKVVLDVSLNDRQSVQNFLEHSDV